MLEVDIPGFGALQLEHLVSDFTGTLSVDADRVVAIGNGANDRRMLRVSRLGIAVLESEGCATDAMLNADILVRSIHEGLLLLLNPLRIAATLKA